MEELRHRCFWYNNFVTLTRKEIISRTIEQIIPKIKEHYLLKYYIKDSEYTKLVNHLSKNYDFKRLLDLFSELDASSLFFSNIEYEIIEFTSKLDEDDIDIVLSINEKIKNQIQRYEHHNELVESNKSSIIMWSNACACWNICYFMKEQIKKGNTIRLDASMVLVPYSRGKVKKYLCLLEESPLYRYSFEAIYERREVPFIEGILGWIEKSIESEEYKKFQEEYR